RHTRPPQMSRLPQSSFTYSYQRSKPAPAASGPSARTANRTVAMLPPPLSNPDIGVVDREADLQHDLIMLDLAVFEVAARLQHLKPAQVAQGAAGTADRALDRILDAGLRRAADLDDPVDVVFHRFLLLVARMLLCDPRETRPPSH